MDFLKQLFYQQEREINYWEKCLRKEKRKIHQKLLDDESTIKRTPNDYELTNYANKHGT